MSSETSARSSPRTIPRRGSQPRPAPAVTSGTSRLDAFSSEPLKGIGPGAFESYWSANASTDEYVRDAHSLYLEQMAEFGLVGLALIVVVLASGLWLCVRARRTGRSLRRCGRRGRDGRGVTRLLRPGRPRLDVGDDRRCGARASPPRHRPRRRRRAHRAKDDPRLLCASVPCFVAILAAVAQVPVLVSTARVRESAEAEQSRGATGVRSRARRRRDRGRAVGGDARTCSVRRSTPPRATSIAPPHTLVKRSTGSRSMWRNWLALVQVELDHGDRQAAQARLRPARAPQSRLGGPLRDPAPARPRPAARALDAQRLPGVLDR